MSAVSSVSSGRSFFRGTARCANLRSIGNFFMMQVHEPRTPVAVDKLRRLLQQSLGFKKASALPLFTGKSLRCSSSVSDSEFISTCTSYGREFWPPGIEVEESCRLGLHVQKWRPSLSPRLFDLRFGGCNKLPRAWQRSPLRQRAGCYASLCR